MVIGLDGSDSARAALAAAVDEGARTAAEVEVVASYVLADHWTDLYSVSLPTAEQVRAEVRGVAEAMVREVLVKTLLVGVVSGATGGIGWLLDVLWPLWDEENRALHDFVVNTRTIRD